MALIHTCYRITDIDRSVAFYNALGFQEIGRIPIRDEAVNVFMNQPGDGDMPRLELTYNFGVEEYDLGSGYGHIAITSDDLDGTLAKLADQGIQPEKPPYSVRRRIAAVLRQRPRRLPHRDHRAADGGADAGLERQVGRSVAHVSLAAASITARSVRVRRSPRPALAAHHLCSRRP